MTDEVHRIGVDHHEGVTTRVVMVEGPDGVWTLTHIHQRVTSQPIPALSGLSPPAPIPLKPRHDGRGPPATGNF